MISEAEARSGFLARDSSRVSERLACVLSVSVYVALLTILVVGVVPYGAAEFWWKAFLICCILAIGILWLFESYLSDSLRIPGVGILFPAVALTLFAGLQTISFRVSANSALGSSVSNPISADPFSTRFFVLQFVALILLAAMLYRYVNSDLRLRNLVNLVIGVAVVSALYGVLRQTMQHSVGFGLPLLKPDQGYGQFVNNNHFAFLMEMGFGLTLGIIAAGGVKRDRGLMYLGALLPIWTALVLSNSRGGILAMLAQIVAAVLLFSFSRQQSQAETTSSRLANSVAARVGMLIVLVLGVGLGTLWLGGDRLATKLDQADQEFNPVAAELRQNARRDQIWRASWKMFAANPITGVGLGAYWIAVPQFHDASGTMTPQEAHNDYLELLASGGIIGFGLGTWFVVLLVRRIKQNLELENRFRRAATFGAAIALAGVAVHSLVDFGLHVFGNAIVFTVVIVVATMLPTRPRVVAND